MYNCAVEHGDCRRNIIGHIPCSHCLCLSALRCLEWVCCGFVIGHRNHIPVSHRACECQCYLVSCDCHSIYCSCLAVDHYYESGTGRHYGSKAQAVGHLQLVRSCILYNCAVEHGDCRRNIIGHIPCSHCLCLSALRCLEWVCCGFVIGHRNHIPVSHRACECQCYLVSCDCHSIYCSCLAVDHHCESETGRHYGSKAQAVGHLQLVRSCILYYCAVEHGDCRRNVIDHIPCSHCLCLTTLWCLQWVCCRFVISHCNRIPVSYRTCQCQCYLVSCDCHSIYCSCLAVDHYCESGTGRHYGSKAQAVGYLQLVRSCILYYCANKGRGGRCL
ncbi:MAG: hypothetical protein BWX96_02994 [Bacteroidetes bacterium ADurb.Bin145]|nr:MAG: hypothetical protein BWX96_02994 [Bacteroidetes bacterium ADurb.Bin145]